MNFLGSLLKSGATPATDLSDIRELVRRSLGVLVKSEDDLRAVQAIADATFPLPRG